jgi:hypothetical protein
MPSTKPSTPSRSVTPIEQQHEDSTATARAAIAALPPDQRADYELRFARISRAFALVPFIDADGNEDAYVISLSSGEPVRPSKSEGPQSIWVERSPKPIVESFYVIKLGLHLGIWPYPMVDHVKGREDADRRDRLSNLRVLDAQGNARNARTPRKIASLPKGVEKFYRGGKLIAYRARVRDENGRKKYLGKFSIAKYGDAVARHLAFDAANAYRRQLHGKAYREPRKRAA